MDIRRADHSDIRRVADLWVHSFPGRRSMSERMHTLETGGALGGIETVHVAEGNRRLAGALKLLRLTQYYGGVGLPMMGLAAVAVSPEARRTGVGAALCEYALQTAAERGDALSVLFPFRPGFYARFGWAYAGTLHRYRFRPQWLEPVPSSVRLAGPEDESAIRTCYEQACRTGDGLIARAPAAWRQHLEAPSTFAWLLGDGDVRGYILVRYGEARAADYRPLIVRELVALDDDAYRGLLGWISRQRDLWRRVQYDALPKERFDLLLEDTRAIGHSPARGLWAPTARHLRGPMIRIIDVKRTFEGLRDWPGSGAFDLVVRDAHLSANDGRFAVRWQDGVARVERIEGDEQATAEGVAATGPVLSLDIGMLSRLFAADLSVETAVHHGASLDGDAEPVARFFSARGPFRLLDVF